MARRLRLRRWQKQALDQFLRERPRDMLVVASPGSGKTIGALTMVLHGLHAHPTVSSSSSRRREREVLVPERADQMSLFSAISSSAGGVTGDEPGEGPTWSVPPLGPRTPDDPELEVDIPLPPRTTSERLDGTAIFRRRDRLRRSNHDRVLVLVRITGHRHEEVNAQLNERAGITSVSAASVRELERRLREADRWLRSL